MYNPSGIWMKRDDYNDSPELQMFLLHIWATL